MILPLNVKGKVQFPHDPDDGAGEGTGEGAEVVVVEGTPLPPLLPLSTYGGHVDISVI